MCRVQTRCTKYRQDGQDTDKMWRVQTRIAGYRQDGHDNTHKICRVQTRCAWYTQDVQGTDKICRQEVAFLLLIILTCYNLYYEQEDQLEPQTKLLWSTLLRSFRQFMENSYKGCVFSIDKWSWSGNSTDSFERTRLFCNKILMNVYDWYIFKKEQEKPTTDKIWFDFLWPQTFIIYRALWP